MMLDKGSGQWFPNIQERLHVINTELGRDAGGAERELFKKCRRGTGFTPLHVFEECAIEKDYIFNLCEPLGVNNERRRSVC